jgi:tol-pal system protein YbgF
LNKNIGIFLLILFLLISACASTQDLEKTRLEFGRQTDLLQSKIQTMDNEIKDLQSQSKLLSAKTKSLTESTSAIRQNEANEGADITDIREMLETSTGRLDALEKESSDRKTGMEKLGSRISLLEKYLDIGGGKVEVTPDSDLANKPDNKGKPDSDTAYDTAFNSFREEKFDQARSLFESFVTRYPTASKAADAYYWIGECYYFEGNFDQAILHYDKVVKDYPATNKVPNALLKEGLSFYKLGDKITAKILLQQVVESYPDTGQALIARKKMQEIE